MKSINSSFLNIKPGLTLETIILNWNFEKKFKSKGREKTYKIKYYFKKNYVI